MKKFTAEELKTKYAGKYINTYPYHTERKDKYGNWVTVYEVRSVKNEIWENHNLPEDEII